MKCSIYLPPKAELEKVPVLYWLSGLTCTHENFITKAGAQQTASELGLMLVVPDTSPRGAGVDERMMIMILAPAQVSTSTQPEKNGLNITGWKIISSMNYQKSSGRISLC